MLMVVWMDAWSWPDLERDHQIITNSFFGCDNYFLLSSFSELAIAESGGAVPKELHNL